MNRKKTIQECYTEALSSFNSNRHNDVINLMTGIDDVDCLNLLAASQQFTGLNTEAEESYTKAIALDGDFIEGYCNLATLQIKQGKYAIAEQTCLNGIARKPNSHAIYNILGMALSNQGKADQAIEAYRHSITLRPDYPDVRNNLSILYRANKQWDAAIEECLNAIRLDPSNPIYIYNMADILTELNRPEQALNAIIKGLNRLPENPMLLFKHGVLLANQGRYQAAAASYMKAISVNPNHADSHYNLGILLAKAGNLRQAWREMEWRFHSNFSRRSSLNIDFGLPIPPQWRGEPLDGKSILILPEQGHGDFIQFSRYLENLKKLGAMRVTLACRRPMLRLFENHPGVDEVIPVSAIDDTHDYSCWIMRLPIFFNTNRIQDIPRNIPYIAPDESLINTWSEGISPDPYLKVGICWRGSHKHGNDKHRSIPDASMLAPLINTPGSHFYSLQVGMTKDDAHWLETMPTITDLGQKISDFADTAAIIAQLDLVITVDTAVAHLAGALGKPVWVLLPSHQVDWRWLQDRSDSPWYPEKMRLFRKKPGESWTTLLEEIQIELTRQKTPHGFPS